MTNNNKYNEFKENMEKYWTERNENLFLLGENEGLQYAKKLKRQYEKAIKEIEEKIDIFYGKYQKATGMDMSDLTKVLDKKELKNFNQYIDEILEYSKRYKFDDNYINSLERLKLKANISRLQELKTQMEFEVQNVYNKVENSMQEFLEDTYEDAYYNTIFNADKFRGFSKSFSSLNKDAIETAVKKKYMTENYSNALWKNKTNLLNILEQQIPQGIILGYNPKKVAGIASKKLDTSYNNTVRLVRTEYNLILNEASTKGYRAAGIDQYQLLATLDNRTSEICQEMDGKIFDLSEKEVGINFPPFHPNCRTTTIPYFEPDEFDVDNTRIAKDNNGEYYKVPANVNYKQWKEGLVDIGDGILRYQASNKTNEMPINQWNKTTPENNSSVVTDNLNKLNVEYNPVNKLDNVLSTEQIINKVGGGDMTDGSCVSTALAYIGNRNGLDVTDFRGGESQKFFGTIGNVYEISKLPGVKSFVEENTNDIMATMKLLKQTEIGKEYYLGTGQHAAIIKKLDKGYQYLELQSPTDNGFKTLTNKALKDRFGCKQSHSVQGVILKPKHILIDIDTLKDNRQFEEILGYINTKNQLKGVGGSAK